MTKNAHSSENVKICAAALRLAAAKGWEQATLDAIAKGAKLSLAKLKQRFVALPDIAALIVAEITREALAAAKPAGSAHDVLFDLLMSRFEIMQKNRKAILSIADAARRDVKLSRALARASLQSAYALIDAAKIPAPPRPLLALGLSAVHGWAFLVWRRDDSRDMAKTMAALDRGLRLAGKAAGICSINRACS
ncbi:MAG: hypothetical protein P4M13_12070 [Alphaproteobacteria bacterium]|nr:hypothetical protein [Alphaproteobacteria bacterium]